MDGLLRSRFCLIRDISVGLLSAGIQSAEDSVLDTLGSNPAFNRIKKLGLLSIRKSLADASASKLTTKISISPEPGAKTNREWVEWAEYSLILGTG